MGHHGLQLEAITPLLKNKEVFFSALQCYDTGTQLNCTMEHYKEGWQLRLLLPQIQPVSLLRLWRCCVLLLTLGSSIVLICGLSALRVLL